MPFSKQFPGWGRRQPAIQTFNLWALTDKGQGLPTNLCRPYPAASSYAQRTVGEPACGPRFVHMAVEAAPSTPTVYDPHWE